MAENPADRRRAPQLGRPAAVQYTPSQLNKKKNGRTTLDSLCGKNR
jgi:hypothetical protein